MFFIFGTHLFGLKRYAYKYMECSNCKQARLFIQTRGFAWAHFFWVPLIPLGYQYSWSCASCAKEDNSRPTSFVLKLLLSIVLSFVLYLLLYEALDKDLGESALWWKLGVGILTAWSLYATFTHFKSKEKSKHKYILPLPDNEVCAICDGTLETTVKKQLQCNDCKCFALGLATDDPNDIYLSKEG